MNIVYTGLDAGSRSFHLAAMQPDGTLIFSRRFPMSEAHLLTAFTAIKGEIHVHLEAGEIAPWIRQTIAPLVHRVVISDPKTNSWIANDPQKCDRIDAIKLADLLRRTASVRSTSRRASRGASSNNWCSTTTT